MSPVTGEPRWQAAELGREALAYADTLHNLARYLTRNATDAEDLVQETYTRALRAAAQFTPGTIDVLDLKNVDTAKLELGKVSALAGHAAFEAVRVMIDLAMRREIDATVERCLRSAALWEEVKDLLKKSSGASLSGGTL